MPCRSSAVSRRCDDGAGVANGGPGVMRVCRQSLLDALRPWAAGTVVQRRLEIQNCGSVDTEVPASQQEAARQQASMCCDSVRGGGEGAAGTPQAISTRLQQRLGVGTVSRILCGSMLRPMEVPSSALTSIRCCSPAKACDLHPSSSRRRVQHAISLGSISTAARSRQRAPSRADALAAAAADGGARRPLGLPAAVAQQPAAVCQASRSSSCAAPPCS